MTTVTSLGFNIFTEYKGRGARKAASELQHVASVARSVASTTTAVMGAATVAAAVWAGSAAKAGLDSNALMQRTNMALETLLGSAAAAKDQLADLREFGKESPIALPVWVRAQQQMIAFGIEVDRVIPMLGAIQDAVAAAGGTEEEISGAVRALSQMASKGKLSAEELQQLGERGIDAAGLVGLAWGETSGEIRSQITEGTIAVEDFFEGFIKGSDMAFGGAAAGLKNTFVGMIDRLRASQRRIGEIFMTPLVDPQGGGAFIELGNAVSDGLNHIEEEVRPFATQMSAILAPSVDDAAYSIRNFLESITTEKIQEFVDVVEEIAPSVTAISAALGAKAMSGLLGGIPILGSFATALSPVAVGLAVLSTTSPELRSDLDAILGAMAPLVPVATGLGLVVTSVLVPAVQSFVPLIVAAGNGVGYLLENASSAPVKFAALITVMMGIAAAAGMVGPGLAAAALGVNGLTLAMGRLRKVMIAHPIMTLAVGLAITGIALDALNTKLNKSNEYTVDFQNNLGGAFTEATASGSSALSGLESDFDSLIDTLQFAEDHFVSMKTEVLGMDLDFTGISDLFSGDESIPIEELEEANKQIAALDNAMAAAVESGMSEYSIMRILRHELGASSEDIAYLLPLLTEYSSATDAAAMAQLDLQLRTSEATAAIIAQAEELRAQNDPLFALVKAQQELATAQENVNAAIDEYGIDSPEAVSASLEAAEALLKYTDAGAAAADVLGNELTPEFLAAAEAAGFTDELVGLLTGEVQNATAEFEDFADDYEANVEVNGVNNVISQAQRIQRWLDNIDRTVQISFQYENFMPSTHGGANIPGMATGGPVIGAGTGTSDSVLRALSNGEFVVTDERVRAIGGFGAVEQLLRYASGSYGKAPASTSAANYGKHSGISAATSTTNVFNFNGPVANERAAEDMIVKAYRNAKQKGRL